MTSNLSYLLIAAFPQQYSTQTGYLYVRKVQIVETPVFNLSPSVVNIQCGSTTPQTFTASALSGVTNYTWNLGANNGWKLSNGSPAPATISTGTSNTITLTPTCGASLSNVSVTGTVSGSNFTSNFSTVSFSDPLITLSGSVTQCTSTATYTLSGAPCNSVVTWASSNTNAATVQQTGTTSTTVTKVNTGLSTISATINACGQVYTVSRAIQFGGYNSGVDGYNIVGPSSACANQTINFSVNILPGATGYTWTYPSAWTVQSGGNGYSYLNIKTGSYAAGGGPVGVRVANACDGGGSPSFKFVAVNNCGFSFTISPNPGEDVATISTKVSNTSNQNTSPKTKIYKALLIDQQGVVKRNFESKGGIETCTISLAGLPTGLYSIVVFDGINWESQQFIKQ